jgi:precorrin-2/cobalt-factor-2 C20-methyltransferase
VLARLGLADDARYVEHASLVDQRVLPVTAAEGVDAPYFSMILVHRRGEVWR